jgi:hypothetical protein
MRGVRSEFDVDSIRRLDVKAITVAAALIYLLPRLISIFGDLYLDAVSAGVQAYSSLPFRWMFWFLGTWMVLGPFFGGYLVASISKKAPIFHGVVVGVVGLTIWSLGVPFGPAAYKIFRVLLTLGLAVSGAWLWTYRIARRSV